MDGKSFTVSTQCKQQQTSAMCLEFLSKIPFLRCYLTIIQRTLVMVPWVCWASNYGSVQSSGEHNYENGNNTIKAFFLGYIIKRLIHELSFVLCFLFIYLFSSIFNNFNIKSFCKSGSSCSKLTTLLIFKCNKSETAFLQPKIYCSTFSFFFFFSFFFRKILFSKLSSSCPGKLNKF